MDKIKSLNIDLSTLQLDYLRPIPVIEQTSDFYWNDNFALVDVQWNYTLEVNIDKLSQVKEIIQKACLVEVSDEEYRVRIALIQQLLHDYLQNDQELLKNCGFSCHKLSQIIEKNREIVHFLLLQICRLEGFEEYKQIQFSYLEVFISSDITQNTLEVFAKLYGEIRLPQPFVTIYVNYCIEFCNNIKEKQLQNKQVRYVSVFIQYMLKQRAFAVKDVLTDVRIDQIQLQAFCIEFSKVGEVSKLFKQVKALEPIPQ